MATKRCLSIWLAVLLVTPQLLWAAATPVCSNQVGLPVSDCAVSGADACRQELRANPNSLPSRLALCDLLASAGQREAAVQLLQEGLKIHAGESFATNVIRRASSLVEESAVALDAGPDIDVLDEYMLLRCEEYQSESHCRDVTRRYPELPGPYVVLGDIAGDRGNYLEAIQLYRTAQAKGAQDAADKLAASMRERDDALRACYRRTGPGAIEVCEEHRLEELDDASRIALRLGDLYLLQAEYAEAADWYGLGGGQQGRARQNLVRSMQACASQAIDCDTVVQLVGDTAHLQPLIARADEVCTANPDLITGKCAPQVSEPSVEVASLPVPEHALPTAETIEMDADARLAEIIDVCEAEAIVMGWLNALTCNQVATASLQTDTHRATQDRVRREIDNSLISACENAISQAPFEEAVEVCNSLMKQVFLETSAVSIAQVLDAGRNPESATNVPFAVDPQRRFVVTY